MIRNYTKQKTSLFKSLIIPIRGGEGMPGTNLKNKKNQQKITFSALQGEGEWGEKVETLSGIREE